MVWVLVQKVALEKGWRIVDFWRVADELWVYAVQLIHCLVLAERSVKFFELFALTWCKVLIFALSKPWVRSLLVSVYLHISLLLITRFEKRGLFVAMTRIFNPILLPFLKPKNHLVKPFQLNLITLKFLNISILLILIEHHRRCDPTHHIDRLWRLKLIFELAIEMSFRRMLDRYRSASFRQFK